MKSLRVKLNSIQLLGKEKGIEVNYKQYENNLYLLVIFLHFFTLYFSLPKWEKDSFSTFLLSLFPVLLNHDETLEGIRESDGGLDTKLPLYQH